MSQDRGVQPWQAANWRTVLAVDAALGVALAIAGATVMVRWSVVLGALAVASGASYVAMVVRRGRQWQARRRENGLD